MFQKLVSGFKSEHPIDKEALDSVANNKLEFEQRGQDWFLQATERAEEDARRMQLEAQSSQLKVQRNVILAFTEL